MSTRPLHLHPSDLQGLARLGVGGVRGVTDLVEHMHYAIQRIPGMAADAIPPRTSGITGLVYRSVHGVTGLVGGALEIALGTAAVRLGQAASTPERDRLLAVLNGVLGDHLEATGNPLAIDMRLRYQGHDLSPDLDLSAQLPDPDRRLVIFVHGLCLDDRCWQPRAEDQPSGETTRVCLPEVMVRRGRTVLHLRYNTGRPIHANGREFARLLQRVTDNWPGRLDRIAIVGHSMGALVARSAAHAALHAGHGWPRLLHDLVFLAAPHLGSPLERAGHGVDRMLGISRYSAPFARIGRMRSAGITDLRYGRVLADEVSGPARLPGQTRCFAVAATLDDDPSSFRSRRFGDGLVPVPSALGRHPDPARCLPVEATRRHVASGTGHLEIMHDPEVARRIIRWLESVA
mgnify:CR=1 FL=1